MSPVLIPPLRPDLAIIGDLIKPDSRILDLGCGDGALLSHLARTRGVRGYGLEIDPAKLAACVSAGINVIQADLDEGLADFAVVHDRPARRAGIVTEHLFSYQTLAILGPQHAYAGKAYLQPRDFASEVLISYPVDEEMLDVVRHFLAPRGVRPKRRNAELTVAILQLVASGRGIAALPEWSVKPYLERGYVVGKPLGAKGLRCELHGAMPESLATKPFMRDFVEKVRGVSL